MEPALGDKQRSSVDWEAVVRTCVFIVAVRRLEAVKTFEQSSNGT